MPNFKLVAIATYCALAIQCFRVAAAEPAPSAVDIRDPDGKVIVSADQIRSYDWATHTLTLEPGQRVRLGERLYNDANRPGGKHLVSGIPFVIAVGGKPVYEGKFTTMASSFSFDTPVIVFEPVAYNAAMVHDRIRIQLGYPTEKFFKGKDPRGDKRIEEALRATGKLANTRDERIQWVAASLAEMHSIEPGMARQDLLSVFVEEGGVSNRFEQRFAYRDCPYFKVNVKFEAVESPDDKRTKLSTDKITQISPPFLEWTIAD